MPYVEKADRKKLDPYINDLAESIAKELSSKPNKGGKKIQQQEEELPGLYKRAIIEVSDAIIGRESGKDAPPSGPAQRLGQQIFDVAKRQGGSIRVGWLGNFNYSITRLIQMVPRNMVVNLEWQSEFRYFIYAMTVGAIEQCALEVRTRKVPGNIDWVLDGLVGTLFDIKDEYKRRVNVPYEAVQVKKSGDVYDTPYRTEVIEVKDADGNKGYQEIGRDYRGITHKKSEDKSI